MSWKIKIIVIFEEKPNITNQKFYHSPGLMSYVTCIIIRNDVLMKIWNKHKYYAIYNYALEQLENITLIKKMQSIRQTIANNYV